MQAGGRDIADWSSSVMNRAPSRAQFLGVPQTFSRCDEMRYASSFELNTSVCIHLCASFRHATRQPASPGPRLRKLTLQSISYTSIRLRYNCLRPFPHIILHDARKLTNCISKVFTELHHSDIFLWRSPPTYTAPSHGTFKHSITSKYIYLSTLFNTLTNKFYFVPKIVISSHIAQTNSKSDKWTMSVRTRKTSVSFSFNLTAFSKILFFKFIPTFYHFQVNIIIKCPTNGLNFSYANRFTLQWPSGSLSKPNENLQTYYKFKRHKQHRYIYIYRSVCIS